MSKIDEQLDLLNKIEPVEAPFFLFTKIEEKIKNYELNNLPKRRAIVWGSLATCCFVLTLLVCIQTYRSNKTDIVADSLELLPENSLYNE